MPIIFFLLDALANQYGKRGKCLTTQVADINKVSKLVLLF